MRALPAEPAQLLRFALVGTLTAAIYGGGYLALRHLADVPPAAAATAAYLAAIAFQYLGHSRFTFRVPSRPARVARFLSLNGFGWILSVAITLAVRGLGGPDWAASLAVVGILPAVNWIVMRLWVFA